MATRWKKARVIASSGLVVGAVWGSSMALFTDTADSGTATFTSGTVDITATDASTSLSVADMAPGDAATAPITIGNAGTLDLRYAMTSAATGDTALRAALTVTVKTGVTTCSNAGFSADGTQIATGDLDTVAFGDSAAGAQSGDRSLAAGASEVLCVQVTLPTGTSGTAPQGKTASATFSFAAEQTKNN